jgi:CHAT domain-containing protein
MNAWDISFPPLRSVEDEIDHVRAAAGIAGINVDDSYVCTGDAAIVGRTAQVFQHTNLAHIACHGTQLNASEALSSGFSLTDGNLSVFHLMSLDLKDAFFAFLSACETAKGDEQQPDQTIHLAAAMLFVGFRSIVATMW